MPISADDIRKAINRSQHQLDAGSRAAIADAIVMLFEELQSAPVLMWEASETFPEGQVAIGTGAVGTTPNTPPGFFQIDG